MSVYEYGNVILTAGAASASSDWMQMARTLSQSATVRVSASAATLQATLAFKSTDFDAKSGSEAVCTLFTAACALPTGVTITNGVITFNNPSAGTIEIPMVTAAEVNRWLQAVWTYTSGGGTVAVNVALSGW